MGRTPMTAYPPGLAGGGEPGRAVSDIRPSWGMNEATRTPVGENRGVNLTMVTVRAHQAAALPIVLVVLWRKW